MRSIVLVVVVALGLPSCMSGGGHRDSLGSQGENRLTAGTVQRKVTIGMPGSGVVEALGSPNVVTTDEQRREVWVYDRISTERVASSDSGGGGLIFFGYSRSAAASSTTQRSLTVIIKFDNQGKVRDFAYHASRF